MSIRWRVGRTAGVDISGSVGFGFRLHPHFLRDPGRQVVERSTVDTIDAVYFDSSGVVQRGVVVGRAVVGGAVVIPPVVVVGGGVVAV